MENLGSVTLSNGKNALALAALYNASKPQGLGFLHATPEAMTEAEAADVLAGTQYVDYLRGRVIKTDFSKGKIDLRLFDRDNGHGAGLRALTEAGLISA